MFGFKGKENKAKEKKRKDRKGNERKINYILLFGYLQREGKKGIHNLRLVK